MIKGLMLAWYGSYGGDSIGNVLAQWEQAGIFAYVLPFLLIFALVFGILTQIKIFKDNKAVNGVIALVVGLMALQFGFVSQFFAEIFPRLGIGLAVMLVVIILVGMFSNPDSNGVMVAFFGVGVVISVIVLVKTAGALGWSSGYWWQNNWTTIVGLLVLLAVIGIIIAASSPPKDKSKSPFAQMLRDATGN